MDLELWQLAVTVGRDPRPARRSCAHSPQELAADYAAGALPAVAQTGLPGLPRRVRPPRRGGDRPWHAAVVRGTGPYPRHDHQLPAGGGPRAGPGPAVRPGCGTRRGQDPQPRGTGRGPEPLAGAGWSALPAPGPAAVRAARTAQVLHRPGARGNAPAARRRSAPSWPGPARSPTADDVYFLEFDEVRVGLRGADLKGLVADRRAALRRRTARRRHIPRLLLSDGTDVEAAVHGQVRPLPAPSPAHRRRPAPPPERSG